MRPSRGWHVDRWPPLAWLETVFKSAAIAVAFVVWLSPAQFTGSIAGPTRWIALGLLGMMTLGLCAAIFDRWIEKEIMAMAFVLPNLAGHAVMLGLLLSADRAGQGLVPFAGLMVLGDLAKLVFLHRSGFTVRNVPSRVLRRLTALYALGYVILLLLPLT